mgnify:CR=1 FL=1
MRVTLALSLVLLLVWGASSVDARKAPAFAALSEDALQQHFLSFINRHEKRYGTEEFQHRFTIFKRNLAHIDSLNADLQDGATYGITKFADMTPEEFKAVYLPRDFEECPFAHATNRMAPLLSTDNLPESFDWVSKGAVTPVKNQGACGSCWSFSTTGNIEGQMFLKHGKLESLSEQNLVDCDHHCTNNVCDSGCGGGLQWNAFEYIIGNGGIDTEASYPYTGVDGTCKYNPANSAAKLTNWTTISSDEDQLAAWLFNNGPVAISLDATWMQFYIGGISDPAICSQKKLDHAVLLVGFGKGKTLLGHEVEYWLIKNSWGHTWGEKGYIKIIKGKNKCGLADCPCSAVVA